VAGALRAALTSAAEAAAEATGFVRRRSKVSGSAFARTLVFGRLANPRASLGAALATLRRGLAAGARISQRATAPPTYRLLLALTEHDLAA
jgi:hypothetical protein